MFNSTGSALTARSGHIAVRLLDGRVLVAGGRVNAVTPIASAEIYDPATSTWSATASMRFARGGHAAALLTDGRVLVIGGYDANISCADDGEGNSAELYDPTQATWTLTATNLNARRSSPVAVMLADGRVLVAGGGNRCGGLVRSAEIFDPASGAWTRTGDLNAARWAPAGVLLPDGRVLVAGGVGAGRFPFSSLPSAEIYDPATGTWTLTGAMRDPRLWTHDDVSAAGALMLLPDGNVLTAGGLNRDCSVVCDSTYLNSAEIFSPASGTWSPVGDLATARSRHQMAVLANGSVLVVGGRDVSGAIGSAEVFDPGSSTFVAAGSLLTARFDFTATRLEDGGMLIAEGQGQFGDLRSAELFAVTNGAPAAIIAGPEVVPGTEGSTLVFDGSRSSDPDGDALTFSWNFGDGSAPVTGATASHAYSDNGSFTVQLTVSDGTLTSTATVTAAIANVEPVVNPIAGATLSPGETYTANGSFTDPAAADTWTATVDYGDGSGEQPLTLSGTTFNLSHTYAGREAASLTVTVTVRDDDGGVGTTQATVIIQIDRAPIADAGTAVVMGSEGTAVAFDGTGSSDPDGDALTFSWNFGDGSLPVTGATASHAYGDNGTYTVQLTVSDGSLTSTAPVTAQIANVAPTLGPITAPVDPVELGTPVTASASFTDHGTLDTHTGIIDWGDGTSSPAAVTEASGSGSASGSHVYSSAGVYTLTLTVTDDDGGFDRSVYEFVVVFNSLAGFVTGGGWINSPRGAYPANPSFSGKATFGFVSKYPKGATTPSGHMEFNFQVGNLHFHSASFDWLVVSGSKVRFKGSGRINGAGDFAFLVSAVDGDVTGGDPDTFRMKIWDNNTGVVIYDSELGLIGDGAAATTVLGGGSIVIHD